MHRVARSARRVLAGALAFSLAACGGDSTAPAGINLTDTEFSDMFAALSGLLTFGGGAGLKIADPRVASVAVDTTVACAAGGTARITGNSTTVSGTTTTTGGLAFSNCRAQGSAATWTFNGSISTTNVEQASGAGSVAVTGNITVSNGTKSGSCRLTVNSSYDANGNTTSASGTACGRPLGGG